MPSNPIKTEPAPNELSSYEKLRINNIKRNNAKLRELGLISEAEEEQSNAIAEGINEPTKHNDKGDKENTNTGASQKKRKRKEVPTEGSRKSLRIQGVGVDMEPLDKIILNKEDILAERIVRVKECREVRLRAAKAVAAAGGEKAAEENPTATYEHCLMRVKSLSDKRLQTRVSKAIASNLLMFSFYTDILPYFDDSRLR